MQFLFFYYLKIKIKATFSRCWEGVIPFFKVKKFPGEILGTMMTLEVRQFNTSIDNMRKEFYVQFCPIFRRIFSPFLKSRRLQKLIRVKSY